MATKAVIGLAAAAAISSSMVWAGEGKQCGVDDKANQCCCSAGFLGLKDLEKVPPGDDRWTFGVHYHYIDADGDERNTEDSDTGFRFTLGKPVGKHIDLELGLGFGEFDQTESIVRPSTLEQEEVSLSLDALYYFSRKYVLQPYFQAGVGLVSTEDSGSSTADTTDFMAGFGMGLRWIFDDHFSLRGDIRHRWVFWDEEAQRNAALGRDDLEPDEFVVNVGLVYAIGDAPEWKEEPTRKRAQTIIDADADGLDDASDRCPGTPAGTPVDANGCPVGGDSDGDGVNDALDKCPNTPAGTRVDVNGCPLPETVVVYFAFDSAALTSESRNALNRVAANLANKNFVIAIANGHADSTGTEEYNIKLSEQRAAAVSNYLVSRGVEAKQIRQRAYGETRPATSNDTAAGRAKNRRVEINLLRQ